MNAEDWFAGLDTNILIDFIQHPFTQDFVLGLRMLDKKELCTSEMCIKESERLLESDKDQLDELLVKCKITMLKITKQDINFARDLLARHKSENAHWNDMLILANFMNNNVNILVSADNDLQNIAEKEGLQVIKIPDRDTILKILFRKAVRF